MADIVNLRQVRKAKKRASDAASASANRAKFGQTKAVKLLRETEAERQARNLDGARRDREPGD